MYDEFRYRLYDQYEDACTRIALLSVRDLAESVSIAFPDATTVVMSDSDQGPYLVIDYVEDHTGQIVADPAHLEAAGINEDSTAKNLFTDNLATPRWQRYAPQDDENGAYRLNIADALSIPTSAFTPTT